jgi:hypothetical protein
MNETVFPLLIRNEFNTPLIGLFANKSLTRTNISSSVSNIGVEGKDDGRLPLIPFISLLSCVMASPLLILILGTTLMQPIFCGELR